MYYAEVTSLFFSLCFLLDFVKYHIPNAIPPTTAIPIPSEVGSADIFLIVAASKYLIYWFQTFLLSLIEYSKCIGEEMGDQLSLK